MLRDLLDVHRDVRLTGHVAQVQDRLALVLLADELRVALNEEVASEHHAHGFALVDVPGVDEPLEL